MSHVDGPLQVLHTLLLLLLLLLLLFAQGGECCVCG
jgi:hypothetical protein